MSFTIDGDLGAMRIKRYGYCRDEVMRDIAVELNNKIAGRRRGARGPTKAIPAKQISLRSNDWSIVLGRDRGLTSQLDHYLRLLWRAATGDTNSEFSPLASPYALRWLIAKARRAVASGSYGDQWSKTVISRFENMPSINDDLAVIRRFANRYCRDFFYKSMLEADANGVKLCDDVNIAWQLKKNVKLGHMGLDGLQKGRNAIRKAYDFEEAFPPSIFMK